MLRAVTISVSMAPVSLQIEYWGPAGWSDFPTLEHADRGGADGGGEDDRDSGGGQVVERVVGLGQVDEGEGKTRGEPEFKGRNETPERLIDHRRSEGEGGDCGGLRVRLAASATRATTDP